MGFFATLFCLDEKNELQGETPHPVRTTHHYDNIAGKVLGEDSTSDSDTPQTVNLHEENQILHTPVSEHHEEPKQKRSFWTWLWSCCSALFVSNSASVYPDNNNAAPCYTDVSTRVTNDPSTIGSTYEDVENGLSESQPIIVPSVGSPFSPATEESKKTDNAIHSGPVESVNPRLDPISSPSSPMPNANLGNTFRREDSNAMINQGFWKTLTSCLCFSASSENEKKPQLTR